MLDPADLGAEEAPAEVGERPRVAGGEEAVDRSRCGRVAQQALGDQGAVDVLGGLLGAETSVTSSPITYEITPVSSG